MDLAVWLRSLGLEQYEAAFRENGVDEKVLPKLTAEDVKDLGVIAVGHRRKLLEAIAELRSAKTEPAPSEGSSPAPAAPSKDSAAERRQLTVLFARQVHGWFTEGFDTRDLKEARALLEELAA